MARLTRLILPGIPHHVAQRGNRRERTFLGDDARRACLALLPAAAGATHIRCLT